MRLFRPLLALALAASLAGCTHTSTSSTTSASPALSPASQAMPRTPAEAQAMKAAGSKWSDCDIRRYYNQLVSEIPIAEITLKTEGKSVEERARRASETRHNARMTARAMMESAAEVEDLRKRDHAKYGNPDGPTFEQLVEKNRKKGLSADEAYWEIIESSQRTDEGVNRACGLE